MKKYLRWISKLFQNGSTESKCTENHILYVTPVFYDSANK